MMEQFEDVNGTSAPPRRYDADLRKRRLHHFWISGGDYRQCILASTGPLIMKLYSDYSDLFEFSNVLMIPNHVENRNWSSERLALPRRRQGNTV
jgi:hypothetical protein